MRWTPVPLIDPGLGLSRRERRAIRNSAWKRWMNNPWNAAVHAAVSVGAIVGVGLLSGGFKALGAHGWYWSAMRLVLMLLVLSGVFMVVRRWGYGRCLWEELQVRGHDVCGRCGYLMEGLDGVCPECGEARK